MKRIFFLIFSVLLFYPCSVSGQSDPQISQYMFSEESYNPSVLANHKAINLLASWREQWMGFPNAPRTVFIAGSLPFNAFLNKKQGVGIAFVIDEFGIFSNNSTYLQYALRFKLNESFLSVGTNIGFVSQVMLGGDSSKVFIPVSDYHKTGDPAVPKQTVRDNAFDMGLGVVYSGEKYYLGLSVMHLFSPQLDLDEYVRSYIGRTAYFTCGYDIPLNNVKYIFKPSLLVKSDFISFQTDLSARVEKNDKYWLGLSWRLQDAVVFYGGLNLLNGLVVGCSYDLATSKMFAYSKGSFEVFMRYSVNIGKNKLNKYKSVRVL